MRRLPSLAPALAFVTGLLPLSMAFGQFEELARRVPSSANAIALVNVEKLMASPVAVKEKWAENQAASWESGLTLLPPDTKQAVLAMHLDLQLWLPLWETAVMELNHEPSIDKVVAMTGGSADTINGVQVVGLPEDAYVVKFGKTTGALMAPANRQSVARWLREVESRSGPGLSPYLTEAFGFANDVGTPVILALDMEDAMPIDAIKAQLDENKEFLAQHKLDAAKTAQVLAGMRGLTLGITFADKPFGKVKVDFRENLTLSPDVAKAALIHALENHGAMIDEFDDWKPAVSGKQITLEGYLTTSGIRRISSLFARPPSLKAREVAPGATQPQSQEQLVLQASQNYFKRVGELIKDMQQTKRSSSNATIPQIGVWMNKYAGKIDQLSVLNVDPELIAYGAAVSDSLRAGYNSIRSGAANTRVRQVNTPMQYNYYSYGTTYGYTYRDGYYGAGYTPYGSYGTVAVPDQLAYRHERTRIHAEERISSANTARDYLQNIQVITTDIRRKMTQKYQVDF